MSRAWQRVEPNGRDQDLEEGLENRVADPLWMLARQWQLGEFRGEDAASPIHARVVVESSPVRNFRNRAVPGAPTEPWSPGRLLESRVEAERVTDGPAAIALAAEAGLRFLRGLDAAGLGAVRSGVDWRGKFGFDPWPDPRHLPLRTQQRLGLIARRAIDGRKLAVAADSVFQSLVATVDPSAWPAVSPVLQAWRANEATHFDQPAGGGDCWVDERLEYAFSLGVPTPQGTVTLLADGYPGGHLDWHAFRMEPTPDTASIAAPPPPPPKDTGGPAKQHERLLSPVSFRGQPAPRWWEFEDRTVYFGNLAAGPADVARLIVAEFAAVFSDDYFVIPIPVDTGTLNRVTSLEVLDVFGGVNRIVATAVADYADYGASRPWAFFELGGDRSAADGLAPYLFVPPVLASSLGGRPLERVSLLRDEAANLGWAIEEAIELPTGTSMRRRQLWRAGADDNGVDEAGATGTPATDAAWRYRLQSRVPPWWIPFIPERIGASAQVRLRRARMQSWQDMDPSLVGAKGRVVGVARPLRLFEEEVPRGGVNVTRAWQLARGTDGSVHLWMARHKRPGRGGRASGLHFDELDRSS